MERKSPSDVAASWGMAVRSYEAWYAGEMVGHFTTLAAARAAYARAANACEVVKLFEAPRTMPGQMSF